jgi:spore germination protein YaaH
VTAFCGVLCSLAGAGPAVGSVHYEQALAHRHDRPVFAARISPARGLNSEEAVSTGLRREVFGFLPYWVLEEGSLTLDYDALSTIAYWGVGAAPSGHLVKRRPDGTRTTEWAGWRSTPMTTVLREAHASGMRVVLTVVRFAWTSDQAEATTRLLSRRHSRARLATEIAAAVDARGADGVNLDFEPIPTGQRANYVRLVRRVRRALDERLPGSGLTVDTTGQAWLGGYDVAALTADGAADAVFVMGYDYRVGGAARAGSIAPLVKGGDDLTQTLEAYLSLTSPSKIILGLPWYGRAWSTRTDALRARTRSQGLSYGYSATVRYTAAVARAKRYGRRYDDTEQSAWTAYRYRFCSSCPRTWRELYYDDARSLGVKYDLADERDLRGVGIWALGYTGSRTALYRLLKTKFGSEADIGP